MKAVNLICYSDPWPNVRAPCELSLDYALFVLPGYFEKYKQTDVCLLVHSNEIFTQWVFCLLLEILDLSLVSSRHAI